MGCLIPTEEGILANINQITEAWDDITGKELDPDGVRKAREEEIREYNHHGVYRKVPITQCWERTGKAPIPVRWIDINKGDEVNPEYRSRLVAKEIKMDNREDLFAATPPLEAKKALISLAMTEGIGWNREGIRRNQLKFEFILQDRYHILQRFFYQQRPG